MEYPLLIVERDVEEKIIYMKFALFKKNAASPRIPLYIDMFDSANELTYITIKLNLLLVEKYSKLNKYKNKKKELTRIKTFLLMLKAVFSP